MILAPNTTLSLGSFQFKSFEIPAEIGPLGVSQSITVHRNVGGDRTVDSMGKEYAPISWGGLFRGSDAIDRVNALKALCDGSAQRLSFHHFTYSVVVRDFQYSDRQLFEIPYRITLEVVADNSDPHPQIAVTAPAVLSADLDAANSLSDLINNSTLAGYMKQVTAAMAQVTNVIGDAIQVTDSVEASIIAPLTAAITQVTALLANAENTIASEVGFAGMAVGQDAAQIAASLVAVSEQMFDDLNCLELNNLLDRMVANVNSLRSSPNTLATAGGNLFDIASAQYGDATAWAAIAAANNLTDPFIQGSAFLTIPLTPGQTDGVLSK